MGSKSIKKNYILNLLQQILILLTPFITAPYVSRVLGADGIGKFSFTSSIIAFFTLFASMGMSSFGQREVSYTQTDKDKRSVVFWNTKAFSFITSFIALVAFLLFVIISNTTYKVIYFVLCFNFLTVAADIGWLFQGMEEFKITVTRNIICRVLDVVCIFVFVHNKDDLLIYIFCLTIINTLCNISYWFFVPKYINKPVLKQIHPFANIKTIISLFIPTIAISLYTILDKTMIGLLSSNISENGYYEQSMKIARMCLTLVTSMGTVMCSRIGHLFQVQDKEKIQYYMYRSYKFVWFLGVPLCIGLSGVAHNFVPWFYGPDYLKVIPLLSILSLLVLSIGINNVTGTQYFIPTKRQNYYTLSVIIGAVVNIISNLLLIPRFNAFGAAIGSVIAETSIAIIELIIIRKELSPKKIIFCSWKYLVAGLVMYVVLLIENKYFVASFINTLIMVITGAITYFIVILTLRDELCLEVVKKIFNKIKKSNNK